MDCDELIDQILADPAVPGTDAMQQAKQQQQRPLKDDRVREYRERLAATVAGGRPGNMDVDHGKALTVDQVEELSD